MTKPNSGIPLGQWSGSDATNALHATIKAFNEVTSAQTNMLIRLTWTITALTAIMTAAVVVQIIQAFHN